MNEFKNDLINIKNKCEELEKNSFAFELYKDEVKKNKSLLILTFVLSGIITLLSVTLIYFFLTTAVVETTTEEIIEMETDTGHNNYVGGDNNGEIENN